MSDFADIDEQNNAQLTAAIQRLPDEERARAIDFLEQHRNAQAVCNALNSSVSSDQEGYHGSVVTDDGVTREVH